MAQKFPGHPLEKMFDSCEIVTGDEVEDNIQNHLATAMPLANSSARLYRFGIVGPMGGIVEQWDAWDGFCWEKEMEVDGVGDLWLIHIIQTTVVTQWT